HRAVVRTQSRAGGVDRRRARHRVWRRAPVAPLRRRTITKKANVKGGSGNKEQTKAQPARGEPRVLGRREVLKGLSTVPALGLFGYAWQKQRQYQQARLDAAPAAATTARGPP